MKLLQRLLLPCGMRAKRFIKYDRQLVKILDSIMRVRTDC